MNDLNKILIYKEDKNIPTPTIAHPNEDLGMDIYSAEDIVIKPKGYAFVDTGIRISFPKGIGAFVANRSSMGYVRDLLVYPGIIDSGYTGNLDIKIYNMGNETIKIDKYSKIAQLVFLKVHTFSIETVSENEFKQTDISKRKENGFGSTGIK